MEFKTSKQNLLTSSFKFTKDNAKYGMVYYLNSPMALF